MKEILNKVVNLVKQGLTIDKACEQCEITRSFFYRNADAPLKRLVKEYKAAQKSQDDLTDLNDLNEIKNLFD